MHGPRQQQMPQPKARFMSRKVSWKLPLMTILGFRLLRQLLGRRRPCGADIHSRRPPDSSRCVDWEAGSGWRRRPCDVWCAMTSATSSSHRRGQQQEPRGTGGWWRRRRQALRSNNQPLSFCDSLHTCKSRIGMVRKGIGKGKRVFV